MNGAESLVKTLLASGIDTCFANPGTSEMHFVAALDEIPGMRCVLGLFEGVVTGAADGYARVAGKPAAVLMHCGPGLANGMAGLHNAARARTPVLALIGDLASYHREMNPPLARDIERLASVVSPWVRTAHQAHEVGAVTAEAIKACRGHPAEIATVILPSDACWSDGGQVAAASARSSATAVMQSTVEKIAGVLKTGESCLFVLGGRALRADGLELARRLSLKTGADFRAEHFNALIERGQGRVPIERISYRLDQGLAQLANYRHIVLVGAEEPIAFFAYPDMPTTMVPPSCAVHKLADVGDDLIDALSRLANFINAPHVSIDSAPLCEVPRTDELSPAAIAAVLGATLPEDAIVVDESMTFGRNEWFNHSYGAKPHDWLVNAGGSIGHGMPMATGAAIAAPSRRVISLEADGSAMFTIQSLWTQARENLDITTLIFSNRRYSILLSELKNVGVTSAGRNALRMTELDNPLIGWVGLAQSLGVEARRAHTLGELKDLMSASFKRKGPFLIELQI